MKSLPMEKNKAVPSPVKTVVELYMEQLIPANEKMADRKWQLQKAAARAYGPASPSGLSATKVKTSPGRDAAFIRRLEKKDELSQRLSARIMLLQSLIDQASGLINRYTTGRERTVLILRYLKGYEWLQISKEVDGLCPKQLRRIARKGMEKIVLPEDAIWIVHHHTAA